jgi:ketosteroid isomerase-like protein
MTQNTSPSELARKLYAVFESHDRPAMDALLAADFRFSSPRDDRIDKAAYFERCWPNSDKICHFELEKVFEQGNDVFVRYSAKRKSDGVRFRNTEFIRTAGGKVVEVDVYFGRDLAR